VASPDAPWRNLGLVFAAEGAVSWADHSALQPTPLLLGGRLRVFAGMRDADGVSRIGWVDLDPSATPPRVLGVSARPALDIGEPGCFDDNGVVPCAVVRAGAELRLYYAGYQLGSRARFTAFGGLATSRDAGESFVRASRVPLVERSDAEPLFRAVHSILPTGRGWRAWYGGGDRFLADDSGHLVPSYDIRTMESPDGIAFPASGSICLPLEGDEVRVGRPFVVHGGPGYEMYFGAQARGGVYRLAYATSPNGVVWRRQPFTVEPGPGGWDAGMAGYPAVVELPGGRRLLLYNGTGMGRAGFGCATPGEP
jgi:hypothetical protein